MNEKELAGKRLKEGWIKSQMMVEVLAVTKDAARSALENHVVKLGREDNVMVTKKEFHRIKTVRKPFKGVERAYSNIVELEVLTQNFDKLVYVTMAYGPSSIEILEPDKMSIDMGEAQGILNTLSELVHKFAAAGLGGILIEAK